MYSSFLNVIDSDEDDFLISACQEEEQNIDLAIEASIQDLNKNDKDLKDILKEHMRCILNEKTNVIIVRRSKLLQTAYFAIQAKSFNCCKQLAVKFSGEIGSDAGGPRREFFRLAMNELPGYCGLFEGRQGYMMFTHNIKLVEQNKYFLAGRLVGMSLTQGGHGISCFHPSVYKLMCGIHSDLSNFDLDDIVDTDFAELIAQLKLTETQEMFTKFISDKGDEIASMGYPEIYSAKAKDKEQIAASLLKYHLYYRVTAEITQFTNGINEAGGLWEVIKQYPQKFEVLFTFTPCHITCTQLKEILNILWSDEGSNKRNTEDATIYCWEVFLKRVEEGTVSTSTLENIMVSMQIKDVLQFITGTDRIPPAGFDNNILIGFYDQDMEEGGKRLPYAYTCALQLFLPRGVEDPVRFEEMMIESIFGSYGFDKS